MLALVAKTAELMAQGRNIIGLAAGEPDFDTPVHIQEAAIRAMHEGHTRYTAVEGTLQLRQAVATKFKRENGLNYAVDELIVGAGAKQIIYGALMATVEAGDEVIIPIPAYPTYAEVATLCGATPVHIDCAHAHGFKLMPTQLERYITKRTKWIVLCSPSNPSGAAYSNAELRALGQVLERHPHVWVMSDDIYEHLLFNGQPFATIAAACPTLRDRCLTINGVSKAYCMTGWRIGYGGGPSMLINAMTTLQSQSTSGPSSVSQAAAISALDGPQDFLTQHQTIYRARRDLVVEGLNFADHVYCATPDGAFYVLPSCQDAIGAMTPTGTRIQSDTDFATYLLDSVGVVVVPGSVFGAPGFFRISYATETSLLQQACERIVAATERLR